jgi:hypothetical protein
MIRPKIENRKKKAAVSEERKKKYIYSKWKCLLFICQMRRKKVDKE